ncbi:MAG: toll/interleukin-1 receptor domain-containing protein, partial [Pirellulales bacterium]|nr:toll/interleukin-1 receptor domain-containing protein [Pirellulales bacterium]
MTTQPDASFDVFLSYRKPDVELARAVYRRLVDAGLTVWFDEQRLETGDHWYREIDRHCQASRAVVPVLTPRWQQSQWTRFEAYGAAVVVPVLVEGEFQDVAPPPLR